MNDHARNISKQFAFSAISNFTIERVNLVDRLPGDGRANLLQEGPEQGGGMCFYALKALRYIDLDAPITAGALVGDQDQQKAQEAFGALGAETRYLLPVPNKATNRSEVFLGRDDGRRLIVRRSHQIHFDTDDLPEFRRRLLLSLVAQSCACLVGNLPVELTQQLLEWGRHLGTYMSLGAGEAQLANLADLKPHALFLNLDEARRATGRENASPKEVFKGLLEVSRTDHIVVMTGGGQEPTFIAHRGTGKKWELPPEDLSGLADGNGYANCLGAGDTLAGAATFLLGMPGTLVSGHVVFEAVEFAQGVATVHLTGSESAAERVRARYRALRPRFDPQPPRPAAVQACREDRAA